MWKELRIVIKIIILYILKKNQDHIPCRFFFYKVVCKNAVHEVTDAMSMIMSMIRAKKLWMNSLIKILSYL